MKKLLLFFIIGSIVPILSGYSSFNTTDVEKEIELKGSLYETSVRSVLLNPIEATISISHIEVAFLYDVGNINVVVYTESGTIIYDNNIDTQTQENLTIDISGWDSGIYQIRFIGSTGQYMYGTFEIE